MRCVLAGLVCLVLAGCEVVSGDEEAARRQDEALRRAALLILAQQDGDETSRHHRTGHGPVYEYAAPQAADSQ